MLTLYGTSKTRALRPLWLLEELGLDYTHEPTPPRHDALKTLSNLGKVPVLDADGTAITDSTAILTYLADREGRFTAPAGTLARAEQDALTFMVLDDLEGQLWTAAKHSFILPEERRVPAVKETARWEFSRYVDKLMERRKGPWLMGDEMTIPDIIAVHCGGWAKSAKFETDNEDYVAYIKQGRAREAFKRAAALP
ncbi:glutathionine S-transferase [Rhodobacteraceae bacterium THAF1]|uniref:glutathione S-transferase family protein n=1 Tax=Palleronia sp. THAF1 TaxID=2587842 RepID=UPI000F40F81A|nr:glutathione S-transferase [Palleronia sp. THAF1]QFU09933.1 glutathionine S-transferase [Palleronia sp. THAF1]VDC17164.1 glutathionine S-transferase [Rhodobacteraceae bacterium THAF1]